MAQITTTAPKLTRSLGLWAIVGLGLGYMTPTVVFDTFAIVSDETGPGEIGGVVPSAYVLALLAMTFTAISYGRMTRIFPSAGSAYTYTSATIHPNVGFVIGWSSLLDYLLLPLVNALIIRSYMEAFFPDVSPWIWVIVYVAAITTMCTLSMSNTSKVNMILVAFEVVLIVVFLFLAYRRLMQGEGNGTLFSMAPFAHEGVQLSLVITGATIVCFSFIGFDAITMYTEEAKTPDTVPKAIVFALLIGGAIFFVSAWFAQSLFPTMEDFSEDALENSALPEMAYKVGGDLFKILLTSAAFAATVASSLASHSSVSRMLYVMGRNGKGPVSRFFGVIHPKYHTPAAAVVFTGAVSLLAIPLNLDFVASLINFGALIAFTFVNITVIVYFAYKKHQLNGPGEIFRNIVLPLIGVAFTVLLWVNLSPESFYYGLAWFGAGVIVLIGVTRLFKRPMTIALDDEEPMSHGG